MKLILFGFIVFGIVSIVNAEELSLKLVLENAKTEQAYSDTSSQEQRNKNLEEIESSKQWKEHLKFLKTVERIRH